MVQPSPTGNKPEAYIVALKETDMKQMSCENQYFFKTRLITILNIMSDNIY